MLQKKSIKKTQEGAKEHIQVYGTQLQDELEKIWDHNETKQKFVELEDLLLDKLNSKEITRNRLKLALINYKL